MPSKIRQGFGDSVLLTLSMLCDQALKEKGFTFLHPTYPEVCTLFWGKCFALPDLHNVPPHGSFRSGKYPRRLHQRHPGNIVCLGHPHRKPFRISTTTTRTSTTPWAVVAGMRLPTRWRCEKTPMMTMYDSLSTLGTLYFVFYPFNPFNPSNQQEWYDGGPGQPGKAKPREAAHMIEAQVNPEAWRLELETVAPQLKLSAQEHMKDWRSHVDWISTLLKKLNSVFPEVKQSLQNVNDDIQKAIEKIQKREATLATQFQDQTEKYRTYATPHHTSINTTHFNHTHPPQHPPRAKQLPRELQHLHAECQQPLRKAQPDHRRPGAGQTRHPRA